MPTITTKFRSAVVRFCASKRRFRSHKVLRWDPAPQLIARASRFWELLQSYPRAVLVAYTVIAIAGFVKAESTILAPGTPYWWSWFDQERYLDSTFALAAGDLSPARHHYPIGYALAAAPFTYLFRRDPFLIVNILCLAGSLWAFMRLCETLGIARVIGGVIFLTTSVLTYSIRLHYVIPWTSTPTTFLILAGLMLGFLPPAYWRAFLLGLIPGLIVLTKPVDPIALVPLAVYYAIACLGAPPPGAMTHWQHARRLFGMGAIGLAAGLTIAAIGHWLINGWALSHYEIQTTRGTVFILNSLPYKLYSLFVDPSVIYGNYGGTTGIFARYPWVFVGACGMILMLFRDLRLAILALCTIAYVAMYAAYYDMIPNGLWYYNNVHYYTWCFPIFGLFAFMLVRRLLVQPSAADTIIVILTSVFLLAWRPVLQPVAAMVAFQGKTAASVHIADGDVPFAIDLDGRLGDKSRVYFGKIKVRWSGRDLLPGHESKVIPTDRGARALLLSPATGRNLTVSWAGIDVSDVHRLLLFKLNWTFL